MDPSYIPRLLPALIPELFGYTKGKRTFPHYFVILMDKQCFWNTFVFNFVKTLLSRYSQLCARQSGYEASNKEALRAEKLDVLQKRSLFEKDILVRMNLQGFRVRDLVIQARYGEERFIVGAFNVALPLPLILLKRFFSCVYEKYLLRDSFPDGLLFPLRRQSFKWRAIAGDLFVTKGLFLNQLALIGALRLVPLRRTWGIQPPLQSIVLDILGRVGHIGKRRARSFLGLGVMTAIFMLLKQIKKN